MNRFQRQLDEWRRHTGVSLAAASVRLNGSLVWSGVSREGNATGASEGGPPYRFPIYSITKTFTAVCLLRLESAGLLRLDDPMHTWLANVPVPDGIRLTDMLRHTSGLPDYGPLRAYHEAVKTRPTTP